MLHGSLIVVYLNSVLTGRPVFYLATLPSGYISSVDFEDLKKFKTLIEYNWNQTIK
jgi:hypothetical protein